MLGGWNYVTFEVEADSLELKSAIYQVSELNSYLQFSVM